MGMKATDIHQLIQQAFPDAVIKIQDLKGDENHYAVDIKSKAFLGKTRVQQHQMVYGALQGHMGTTLHAMALTTGV